MNAAQALLHQIASEEYVAAWDLLDNDLQNAIREELERADTTPTHTEPIHRTDPAELAAHLAPNAAQLAAASAMSFDEALETLMRMAGFVPASKGPADGGSVTGEQTMRRFGLVRDDVVERRRASLNAEIDAAGKGD
jgi:hypothetical protein